MGADQWEVMLLLLDLPPEVAKDLGWRLAVVPGYGLGDALAEYPVLNDPERESAKKSIRTLLETEGR